MGRAYNRGGGGVQSSSSFSGGYHHDPSDIRRSLNRNDVELSALSRLHASMRALRDAAVDEYGDAALVERTATATTTTAAAAAAASSSSSSSSGREEGGGGDDDDDYDDRLGRLSSALTLRAVLRRRLLARVARRLLRVARALDGPTGGGPSSSSSAAYAPPQPPLPPSYGDVVRRYVSDDVERSGFAARTMGGTTEDVVVVREADVTEYAGKEEIRRVTMEALEKSRRARRGGTNTTTTTTKTNGGEGEGTAEGEDGDAIDGVDAPPEVGTTAASAAASRGGEEPRGETVRTFEGDGRRRPLSSEFDADAILRADEEDRPALDRLAEYDPGHGYDKVYHIGNVPAAPPTPAIISPAPVAIPHDVAAAAPTAKGNAADNVAIGGGGRAVVRVTVPIASTIDDHEVNDEGEFLASVAKNATTNGRDAPPTTMQRLPFSLHGSSAPNNSMVRSLLPKERAAEWKRWTRDICDRIPDQVTYEELGVGGPGMAFDMERRMRNNKRKGRGGDGDDDNDDEGGERHAKGAAASNRGGGKVLRKDAGGEDTDDAVDGDAAMGEAENEMKGKTDDAGGSGVANKKTEDKKDQGATTKTFSVAPVPSFYYQDLKRIRNIQSEMVRSLHVQQSRERVIRAQAEYDAAYKRSMDIQRAKAIAMQEHVDLPEFLRKQETNILNERTKLLDDAKRHWERRQYQLKDMEQRFGKEQALNRSVCNGVLQDLKDRVCIRVSEDLKGSGLGTHRLYTEADNARSKGDEEREVSATVLGYMVDSVDRRHNDMLQDYFEFVPPYLSLDNVTASLKTSETMSQQRVRLEREMRAKVAQLDVAFNEAERKRTESWMKLIKAKGGGGSSGGQSAPFGGSIASKAKPRSRKSVPAGGVGEAVAPARQSYPMQMQAQPGPGYVPASYYQPQRPPAAATQMHAQMVAPAAAQMMMQPQIVRVQTMVVQNQPQQMSASHLPQPGRVPSSISVTTDPSFAQSAPSIFAPNIANVTSNVEDTLPSHLDFQQQHASEAKQSKYVYGDKYSQTNVNARKNADGTVVPASTPKLLPDGTYARPAGRQRKGMDWDAINGRWYPVAGGGGSSYSGSGNEEG